MTSKIDDPSGAKRLRRIVLGGAAVFGMLLVVGIIGRAMPVEEPSAPAQEAVVATPEKAEMSLDDYSLFAAHTLKESLRDPSGVKFRNVVAYRSGEVFSFCGEVNAKNGYGGMTGFQRFYVMPGMAVAVEGTQSFDLLSADCAPQRRVGPVAFGWL